MNRLLLRTLAIGAWLSVVSCQRETTGLSASPSPAEDAGVLLRIGTQTITQGDLDHHLAENPNLSRDAALETLTERARLTHAAIDAGLESDPVARAEVSRILISRLRETRLDPQLRSLASQPIPESRLREIYESRKDQFQSAEKRQVAMLWLNPGNNPERVTQYTAKLNQAREWLLANDELLKNPDQGFSMLSVDHSEHASTRFKQGVLGWLENRSGQDSLTAAAARIAFSLENPGDVSEVVALPEGLFLVRFISATPASVRPFESVSAQLEQAERRRMQQDAEAAFLSSVMSHHPSGPSDGNAN
jgi:PPIC-type PPIASE domain